MISDCASRNKLLTSLPKRFDLFVAACNLNRRMKVEEFINATVSEDQRLEQNYGFGLSSNSETSVKYFICQKLGQKAKSCRVRENATPWYRQTKIA